jgi:lysophospholipase L1-like esterase
MMVVYGIVSRSGPELNSWAIRNAPFDGGAVVCWGDSLVSGVGAESGTDTYPAQLGRELGRAVLADGTPGITTGEALAELRRGRGPQGAGLVIVTLGGNDMLHRVGLQTTLANLAAIFQELQASGSMVAFTAIEGPMSAARGREMAKLCERQGVILVPDVLGGILNDGSLKSDPIHPNGSGYAIMAERVARTVRPFL